jgi:hypothetical protein
VRRSSKGQRAGRLDVNGSRCVCGDVRISGMCVRVSGRLSESVNVQCHDATMMLSARIGAEGRLRPARKKSMRAAFPAALSLRLRCATSLHQHSMRRQWIAVDRRPASLVDGCGDDAPSKSPTEPTVACSQQTRCSSGGSSTTRPTDTALHLITVLHTAQHEQCSHCLCGSAWMRKKV